ncbi:3904_t:CDS:10 [Paraglomus occultum]|uniref:3904_t:CDS:1 n=1 Tax=Paraglomus occultum TaxID=144539 RepID=A0A9N9FJT2_9GLOM|nr:3904_t:CDS:10 [Paraglomus occultum]
MNRLQELEDLQDESDELEDFDESDDEDALNANDIKYADFFETPKNQRKRKADSADASTSDEYLISDDEEDSASPSEALKKKVNDLFAQDDSDHDDEPKSTFQKQQDKLMKRIKLLEAENVAEKDWTMTGEASSKDRPINSLLEEDLEYDFVSKPVPVITEDVTNKLEEIIKRRILDGTFDDVERKQDPNFRPFLPSKVIELSHEKSQKSLAEIYEDEYVKQTSGDKTNEKDESLRKEHEQIEDMFKDLCFKLDALSNFHYTPKPPKPEVTVITNVAAINMEEIIPLNVNDSNLLAPEEVYDKKNAEVKGETELTSADKKNIRVKKKRAKKKAKKMREREEKVIEKMNPGLVKNHSKKKVLDKLIGQKNVTIIARDGKKESLGKKPEGKNRVNTSKAEDLRL